MNIGTSFITEFDHEMANTRIVLEHVNDDLLDWKAGENLNSIRWVASHLVDIPSWIDVTINADSFDIAPPDGPPHTTPMLESVSAMLTAFDQHVSTGRELIASASDETYMKDWSLLQGGQALMTMPRVAIVRSFILNHIIHHRAFLCVYLRLNGIDVPGMYGP